MEYRPSFDLGAGDDLEAGLKAALADRRGDELDRGVSLVGPHRDELEVTSTCDPHHPRYLDGTDLREEFTRVFDLCHGCRLCLRFCSAFPTLFELIDRHDDQDAGRLTRSGMAQLLAECRDASAIIVRNGNRASDLIDSFKRVSVDQTRQTQPRLDLRTTVQDSMNTIGARIWRASQVLLAHALARRAKGWGCGWRSNSRSRPTRTSACSIACTRARVRAPASAIVFTMPQCCSSSTTPGSRRIRTRRPSGLRRRASPRPR